MNSKHIIVISLFLISVFYFNQGVAMSLFFGGEKKEAVLFSPLEGKLTFNGKPAAGAKLKLWLAWKDQEGESEYFAVDDNGFFSIPKRTVTYKENPLAQMSIGQMVTVEFNGENYLIWRGGKSNTHIYGELGGRPENVTCELTKEELDAHLDHALIKTRCVWKSLNTDTESINE